MTAIAFPLGRTLSYAAAGLGIHLTWSMLLAFLPATLERLSATPFMIGCVMALDPLTALVLLPLVSVWSDRLRSPLGRRLPFVALGALVAVIGLVGLSGAHSVAAAAVMAGLICMGLNGALGPYRALLADECPPERQSVASGWVSLLRECGTLTAFGLGGWAHHQQAGAPFTIAAVGLGLAVAWTIVAEGRQPRGAHESHTQRAPLAESLKAARGLPLLAAAQASWWFAIQAAKIFVVLFIVHEVAHVADITSPAGRAATQQAVWLLALTGLAGLAASIPAGLAASRWGKVPVVTFGLGCLLVAYVLAGLATDIRQGVWLAVLYGVGYAVLQVLAHPMLVEAWPRENQGALAAITNLMVAGPQLLALLVMGALVQLTGSYRAPFWVGACAVVLSLAFVTAYARQRRAARVPVGEAA